MSDEEKSLVRRHLEQVEREINLLEFRVRELEKRLAGIEVLVIPMPTSAALEALQRE